jgi:hypothetical protein
MTIDGRRYIFERVVSGWVDIDKVMCSNDKTSPDPAQLRRTREAVVSSSLSLLPGQLHISSFHWIDTSSMMIICHLHPEHQRHGNWKD